MLINQTTEKAGEMLRHWRKIRHLSQMDLALAANVSTRHLSFVETGRARPSDDLILRLAEAMDLSLRHTNTLLVAAGYAPQFTQWSLDDDQTGMVRTALDHILTQHAPYPAVVINREYDILMTNTGFERSITWLTGDNDLITRTGNLYRLIFAADGLWAYCVDWATVREVLLKRLHEESLIYQNPVLADLYAECVDQHPPPDTTRPTEQHLPVLTVTFQKGAQQLRYFSTVTTFGTAIDVTLQELRIESMFPADEATRQLFTTQLAD